MWDASRESLENGEKWSLGWEGAAVSAAKVFEALRRDEDCRTCLLRALRSAPWPAFFWEMPPINRCTVGRPFEYVILPAPTLASKPADPQPFAVQLAAFEPTAPGLDQVSAFENLSGDAWLIAPRPVIAASDCYAHFASFIREAPGAQQNELLMLLALKVIDTISDSPLWVSTCGLGVSWLHIRLDSWPKYYSYKPYRNWIRPKT